MQPQFPAHFSIIDGKEWTAWKMIDGNTMAGQFWDYSTDLFLVQRVDGTICTVSRSVCRPATPDDIEAACRFYREIGK